ncbi:MAG: hypothetical protein KA354_00095 [Phycisphaerae bacterium]|nr:hypothetical protein [Phycisphaerae bacterium]
MADLSNFGMNIYLGIGLAIVLGFLACVVLGLWVGLRAWFWLAAQKRAQARFHRTSRRADGKVYPPWIGGICDECKRVRRKIYYPPNGPRLCPECYERFWRQEEAARSAPSGTEEACDSSIPVRFQRSGRSAPMCGSAGHHDAGL